MKYYPNAWHVGKTILINEKLRPHGFCTIYSDENKNKIVFVGTCVYGSIHGTAYMRWVGDAQYVGTYFKGKIDGYGKILYVHKDGSFYIYEGEFKRYHRHGYGEICRSNGEINQRFISNH